MYPQPQQYHPQQQQETNPNVAYVYITDGFPFGQYPASVIVFGYIYTHDAYLIRIKPISGHLPSLPPSRLHPHEVRSR